MALARVNVWPSVRSIERDLARMQRMMDRAWGIAPQTEDPGFWRPAIDVFRANGDLVIRAELPGIDPEKDLELSVEDGVLRLTGERMDEVVKDDESFHMRERRFGRFRRELSLPDGVDTEAIAADYTDGVLTITVPIPEEQKAEAKRISVNVG